MPPRTPTPHQLNPHPRPLSRLLLPLLLVLAGSARAEDEAVADGPFKPSWESLQQHRTPAWFADAKFGIWAHWGPQSAPGYGDWYARNLYLQGNGAYKFHLEHFGHPSEIGFKDVIPLWTAEHFDPDALAALYKKAGARYLVSMASHHDNFDNWDSSHQPWNSVHLGPKRDIVGLWKQATVKQGLHFGVSIHNINTWGWYDSARSADTNGPKAGIRYDAFLTRADGAGKWWEGYDPADLYGPPHKPGPDGDAPTAAFIHNWFLRTRELIDRYQPEILEFDLATPTQIWRQWVQFEDGADPQATDPRVGMLIAQHYYNRQRAWQGGTNDGIITLKQLPKERRPAVTEAYERDYPETIPAEPWELEESMGDWHYQAGPRPLLNSQQVVSMLVEAVCRNGNLLLNVVQKPDGTLAGDQADTLVQVGRWLEVNGEAIYGTRPWRRFSEGPHQIRGRAYFKEQHLPPSKPVYSAEDIRFTRRDGALYAIVLAIPKAPVLIRSLAGEAVSGVALLGSSQRLTFQSTPEGLRIEPLSEWPCAEAVVFKISGTPSEKPKEKIP